MLNNDSNMQELILQFEGYAPIGQASDVRSTTQGKELAVERLVVNMVSLVKAKADSLKTLAAAAVAVAFGFTLMFVSAIIGG